MKMFLGLLPSGIQKRRHRPPQPYMPVSRGHPRRFDKVIHAIGQTLDALGDQALTDGERIIWNTSLVLSFMTNERHGYSRPGAKVQHWSAARIGFCAMRLPDAAECVASLVKELAHRTELAPSDTYGQGASLLRLANLKQRFRRIEAENDLAARLDAMIDQTYPWAD
jgi:hypothetical protein